MRLTLPEEVLLLALRAESGKIEPGTQYQHALAGALLAELLLRERIGVDPDPRKPRLHVLDASPLEDPLLDSILQDIAESKTRSLKDWVGRVASTSRLKHRVAASLVARGILHEEEDTVLFVFPRTLYPEKDPGPENELIARLEHVIFRDVEVPDARTLILLSLAHHGELLDIPFSRSDLRARKDRIEDLIRGEVLGEAAQQVVEALRAAAMMAAVISAAVIVPSTS